MVCQEIPKDFKYVHCSNAIDIAAKSHEWAIKTKLKIFKIVLITSSHEKDGEVHTHFSLATLVLGTTK